MAGNPNGYVDNSGKASGRGVNMTLQARPILDLTLTGTLGYADMKYDTNRLTPIRATCSIWCRS